MRRAGDVFRDERGFTTTSMVLSLLVTLSLLFASAQVYRIQSASAQVQDVADAAALAAENQVAEFMLVARFCDAVVLSLTLTGLTVTGLGIAALCTPVTAEMSEALLKAGGRVIDMRNGFSDRATRVLEKLQGALPFLAAACAASVSAANNASSSGSSYVGIAMLVPDEGEPLAKDAKDKADEVVDETGENAEDIRDNAQQAEDAAAEAERCKERAYLHDCGYNPDYCMYERASSLAGLSGCENPFYETVDAWSFGVALDRAQRYYWARSYLETPSDNSVREGARSALRKRFYEYAADLLNEGYVYDTDESFEAYFPLLPTNTDEMRSTSLYTEQIYPITIDTTEIETSTDYVYEVDGEYVTETVTEVQTEQHYVMHAWPGCPNAASPASYGSIRLLDGGGFETCPLCEFAVSSMGKVASASSHIANGFEYHYRAVAQEALDYEEARREAEKPAEEVRKSVSELIDDLVEAAKESVDKRISPKPPGSLGAIAFVVNTATISPAGPFSSGFVAATGSLGPRAAVAGATLVDEGSDEGKTVLNAALDNVREGGGFAIGAAGMVLDAWSWLVKAYSDGQAMLSGAIRGGLDGMPLIGASGLGTWAAEKLEGAIEAIGLQPAEVGALKAVLVNTGHVAAASDGNASAFLEVKKRVIAHPAMSTDLFSSALTEAERVAVARVRDLGDSIEIASIELIGEGGPSIPITIPIPPAAKEWGVSAIQGLIGRIRSYYFETTGVRVWE